MYYDMIDVNRTQARSRPEDIILVPGILHPLALSTHVDVPMKLHRPCCTYFFWIILLYYIKISSNDSYTERLGGGVSTVSEA